MENTQTESRAELIRPYGGRLVNLLVEEEERDEGKSQAGRLPSIQLSDRAVCDLELLATGAFSPLDRFMNREDFLSVVESMRLADGTLFPIPVTLSVERQAPVRLDSRIALRDSKNDLLAVLTIENVYEWDFPSCARQVFGTLDPHHPLVAEMHSWGPLSVSGRLDVLQLPRHYDFQPLRLNPVQTRRALGKAGRSNVVAFQTRNPLHRAH